MQVAFKVNNACVGKPTVEFDGEVLTSEENGNRHTITYVSVPTVVLKKV